MRKEEAENDHNVVTRIQPGELESGTETALCCETINNKGCFSLYRWGKDHDRETIRIKVLGNCAHCRRTPCAGMGAPGCMPMLFGML